MADIIHVSTEEMRNTAQKYVAAQNRLDVAYRRMDRAIKILDSAWVGPAYAAMCAQWKLVYNNISRSYEKMQDAIDELNCVANLFDEKEALHINAFESLDVGTSPFDF